VFQATLIKLTALYLAIIMVISFFFSVNLYRVSAEELNRSYERQMMVIHNSPRLNAFLVSNGFIDQFESEFRQAKNRIVLQLLYTNLFILVAGGALSYFMAKRTLRPIQESHDAQSRFTSDASHELRTPVAAMRSEIEVALRDEKLTKEEAKHLLRSNLEELSKLTALTDGLLRLSRLENNTLEFKPVALDEVVTEAVKRTLPLAKKKSITVKENLQPELIVNGDAASLIEMAVILIDNAIKYSPPQSTVRVELKKRQKQPVLTVRDEGQGIIKDDIPHIFDRFYRADSSRTKESTDGYGLGLAIAKSIASAHQANIHVSSTYGKGTAFHITL
jgi:two-component system, OmpR family, sensor histidine kinase CiaH